MRLFSLVKYTIKILRKIKTQLAVEKTELVVFDSFFPNPLSAFRFYEYHDYIKRLRGTVYTTGHSLHLLDKEKTINYYINQYEYKKQVKLYNWDKKVVAKLAYSVFLNETIFFLPYIEKNKIPFIFTLYPGGGFRINDNESDIKLQKIFNSQYFRKVIVTQNVTQRYLLERGFCREEDIEFIYGVPMKPNKSRFLKNKEKESFDICFVAAKYTEQGRDKGYDIFIDVAHKLNKISEKFKFHIVGGFNENDIDITRIEKSISFYGYLDISELREFYLDKEIIVSPNRTNVLAKGAFDGFPTASVVEAGLCGVVMLFTDELNQNIYFTNNEDCVFINHSVDLIVSKILHLFSNKEKLIYIANKGKNLLEKIFSYKYQMEPRNNLISKYINS